MSLIVQNKNRIDLLVTEKLRDLRMRSSGDYRGAIVKKAYGEKLEVESYSDFIRDVIEAGFLAGYTQAMKDHE